MRKLSFRSILGLTLALVSSSAFAASDMTSTQHMDAGSDLKTMDIETNPLLFVLGLVQVETQFGVSDRITVGPSAAYINYKPLGGTLFNEKLKGYMAGVRGTGYLTGDRFTHSMIVTAEANYLSADYSYSDSLFAGIFGGPTNEYKAHVTGLSSAAMAGYQWNWDFGLNLTLAGGISYSTIGKTTLRSSSGATSDENIPGYSGVSPSGRINVGWVF